MEILRADREEVIVSTGLENDDLVCISQFEIAVEGMTVRIVPSEVWLVSPTIKQEVFPEFSTDMITVSVDYPGAAPEEVEEGVCLRIEEKIQAIDGIKRITSTASEGSGRVTIELLTRSDLGTVLDEVKSRVDTIITFPEEIESPVIQEMTVRRQVVTVAVSGSADERTLKQLAERVRDEIAAFPEITQAELTNARPYEISIEVSEEALRRYTLTFADVANAVSRSSLDLPGGYLKTTGGEILLRAPGLRPVTPLTCN